MRGWLGGTAVGPLRILLVASIVIPACLFAALAAVEYRAAFADAEREAARIAEVARQHASSVFDTQKLVADRVDAELEDLSDDAVRRDEARLHALFRRMIADLPRVQSFLVIDGAGRALLATGAYPVDRSIDYSDRDYFQALKDGAAPTFLSRLQRSRIDGQVFFGLGRRRDAPGAGFNGVIDVAIAPAYFEGFWATVVGRGDDAAGKAVTLVRDDGQILARFPPVARPPPLAFPGSPFLAAIRRHPQAGSYVGVSLVDRDRPERRFVYRRLDGYNAYLVVGRSTASVVEAWTRTMLAQLLFGVPASVALFLVTLVALRRTEREHAALRQVRDEMRRREAAEAAMLEVQRMEAVGQLTSGVAHDFNNLLTIISGNFELIEQAPERTDRVRRLAANGMIAARRGADVTSKLLTFARRQMTRPETLDLNRLVGDFGPVLRQGATEAVSLDFDLAAELPRVRLDPGQLEAALLNLVANARDAMPDGGAIRIETRAATLAAADLEDIPDAAPGRYVRVAVVDDGPGMTPEVRTRAFEPFFTTKDVGRGTGLGLSQVYGFCRQAGGFARIESRPGHGTSVALFLPLVADDRPEDVGPAPRSAALAPPAGEVVLVVEDEPGVLEMTVERLTELGYATLTAVDAATALDRLRGDDRVDILFSDVVMTGQMDGVQLAREARRIRPGLKVLLTTGYASDRRIPSDVPLLPKPYDRAALAHHIGRLAA